MKLCDHEKPGSRKKSSNGTYVLRCVCPKGHETRTIIPKHQYVWHVIGYVPGESLDEE